MYMYKWDSAIILEYTQLTQDITKYIPLTYIVKKIN